MIRSCSLTISTGWTVSTTKWSRGIKHRTGAQRFRYNYDMEEDYRGPTALIYSLTSGSIGSVWRNYGCESDFCEFCKSIYLFGTIMWMFRVQESDADYSTYLKAMRNTIICHRPTLVHREPFQNNQFKNTSVFLLHLYFNQHCEGITPS